MPAPAPDPAETDPSAPADEAAAKATAADAGDAAENEWPEAVTDTIVDSIAAVRQIALRPLAKISRRIVYGLLILMLVLLMLVLGLIGLIHLLDAYIPQEVWLTYAILGGVFTLAGLMLWWRRPRGAAS